METPIPTASAFANFVFRETHGRREGLADPNQEERQKWVGRISEEKMSQYHAVAAQCQSDKQPPVREWKLVYEGAALDTDKEVLECRFLTVNGFPIRCCPDLVLESDGERKHKTVLIVERKVRTGVYDYPSVPDQTWPNVRAQLWCYSWISRWDWLRHENVLLIAEYFWHPYPERGEPVYMGVRGIWRREDLAFNREAVKHFRDFGGKIDPCSNMQGLYP